MAKKAKSKWNGFSLKPRKEMPEGLWMRCPGCEHMLYKSTVEKNLNVCPECNHHFRIEAKTRISYLVDEASFQQVLVDLVSDDPLTSHTEDDGFLRRRFSVKTHSRSILY